jgi:hypothetical protein
MMKKPTITLIVLSSFLLGMLCQQLFAGNMPPDLHSKLRMSTDGWATYQAPAGYTFLDVDYRGAAQLGVKRKSQDENILKPE